ncbi:pentatricopeptide repeat-containing protein At5g11310, mitochondrial [Malus sylvestris]|uniref:pentatricopeptide repeat-containing protein At5g11310, mitochondrial n=1 Tax=Malus sylvestris TaxID=3752 RepID=UPI0021ACA81C|nr:pentatricopeptide repeat-containing protein At5g11310, mitochondrial [Malus sylvestris]XP_050157066.1 pentatricopeptide repeat-containing protein At5g11310, mitochondrial [Malus sylvestris]XP_050157067.1 pentatricopeptide repeat-containing protein At5g11310, mitochondrial [Malus sylvestris]
MPSYNPRQFFSLTLFLFKPNPNLHLLSRSPRFFSNQSWLSVRGNPIIKWPSPPDVPCSLPHPNTNPNPSSGPSFSPMDFSTIANLLTDPTISPGSSLQSALDRTGIEPGQGLVQAVFDHFDSSPKLLHTLFLWAEKQPGFRSSAKLFGSVINVLAKSREFDSAWSLILNRIGGDEEPGLVSADTFVIMIRRYTRAGMPESAIRTFEFASNLDSFLNSEAEMSLFEVLLDSLSKEGLVRVASEYFDRKRKLHPNWIPSVRVYNILLNGWFRSRKLKQAGRLWVEMRRENVKPSVVTYGTLVEGYCRMRRPEIAIELVSEMRREGVEPNAIVYNPIIDALGEAGRFKEALGMMERFLVLESGPTISTYNSLVKGFCKAGDLVGASKILKMMISRGTAPTPTTYNYFFRYFSKHGKIEEGMNLYTKMIESGYTPDRLTFQLLLKMLCEEERLDLAIQVSKEMRSRGWDMDLATSTMLIHLLCNMHKLKEAFEEFEDMIRRGLVPQYITFQRMDDVLRKQGMNQMAWKLCKMMSSVPHSTNLPDTYVRDEDASRARRKSIVQKAEAMSDLLKTCSDPRELVKFRRSPENLVSRANQLIEDIKRKANIQ